MLEELFGNSRYVKARGDSKGGGALFKEGATLALAFQEKKEKNFQYSYQSWYSRALRTVSVLAPDRHSEFRAYYEVDPKRKSLGYGTYVIQDYFKGVGPNKFHYPDFDTREQVVTCFFNQLTILKSIEALVGSTLANIEGELFADLQDGEVAVARQLTRVSLRAAGALIRRRHRRSSSKGRCGTRRQDSQKTSNDFGLERST